MSYNPNIPQAADLISNSQSAILGNFTTIDPGTSLTGVGFARNHVTMTDGTNGGLHSRVDYFQSVTDPVISGFVSSLYTKSVVQGGLAAAPQLIFNAGTPYEITGAVSATAQGFCYLPGGILLKWGSFSSAGGTNTFTFPTGATIPVFSNVFQVYLTMTNAPGSPNYMGYINSFTAADFTYNSTSVRSTGAAPGSFSYLAIGN